MKINTLYFCLIFCILSACVDDANTTTTEPDVKNNSTLTLEDDPSKTVYLRDPVNIVASSGEDYPKTLKDVDFPVMPNSEVTNVGNTDIANGTVVMQMESLNTIAQIEQYYKSEMIKKGWQEKEMKIFQGADGGLNFQSDKYTARILILRDRIQDFRKIAVTLNKKINLEEIENR